jgi:hypothetical protein
LLHAFLRGLVAVDRFPRVLPPVANRREAVVLSFVDDVDLVAAARSVFARPEFAGSRMDGDTLDVAEAERVISGCAPARPVNGLSFGIDPSALMRSTLPMLLSNCCGCGQSTEMIPRPAGTVEVMNSVPSGA